MNRLKTNLNEYRMQIFFLAKKKEALRKSMDFFFFKLESELILIDTHQTKHELTGGLGCVEN